MSCERFVVIRRSPDGASKLMSLASYDLVSASRTVRFMRQAWPDYSFEVAPATRADRRLIAKYSAFFGWCAGGRSVAGASQTEPQPPREPPLVVYMLLIRPLRRLLHLVTRRRKHG